MNQNQLRNMIRYIIENNKTELYPYVSTLDILADEIRYVDSEKLDFLMKNFVNLFLMLESGDTFRTIFRQSAYDKADMTFYNAFVYYVKNTLQNSGGTNNVYEFLTFAGASEDTGSYEVYYREQRNLCEHVFQIEMKESLLCDKKSMMVVLCHEVAHYVGSELRQRTIRLEQIYKICSRIIVLGMKTCLLNLHTAYYGGQSSDLILESHQWKQIEQGLPEWIRLYYERDNNEKYLSRLYDGEADAICEYNTSNMEHMRYIIPSMHDTISELLEYNWKTIFASVITDCITILTRSENKETGGVCAGELDSTEKLSYEKREERIKLCVKKLLIQTHKDNEIFSFANALDYVVYLLKESYADLISILSLHVSPEEYLNTITSQELDSTEGYSTKVTARMAVVFAVMSYTDESKDMGYTWSRNDILSLSQKAKFKQLMQVINTCNQVCFNTDFFDFDQYRNGADLLKNVHMILLDHEIMGYVFHYLVRCKEHYHKHIGINEVLIDFYRKEDCKKHIEQYQKDCEAYIEGYKKEMEGKFGK